MNDDDDEETTTIIEEDGKNGDDDTVMMTNLVMMTKMMRIKKRESIRGVHGRGGSHHCCLAEDSPASWHLPFLHHDDRLHLDHVFDHNIDQDDLSSCLC